MSVRRVPMLLVLACSGGALAAQTTTAGTSAPQLRRRLYALADDSMGGRRSGSPGDFKATESWMASGQAGGTVVVLDVPPGADGRRQLARGLTRIATNPRCSGAGAVDEAQYIAYDDLARVATMGRDAAVRVADLDHRPKLDHPKSGPHAPGVQ